MTHFVRVRHLRGFVDDRGGDEEFEGMSVAQVVDLKIKPWVKKYGKEGGQSIASLVLKKPELKKGPVIMHCMKQDFLGLIEALEDRLGPDAYVYLDIFCTNVLENLEKSSIKWTDQVFDAIGRSGKVILVCDPRLGDPRLAHLSSKNSDEANPVTRLWCLYELYVVAQFEDCDFEVYFSDRFHAEIVQDLNSFSERLRNMEVRVDKARITWPKKKEPLLEAIEKRTSVEDLEKIVDYVIKNGFYRALCGEKTFWQKVCSCCCKGGLPDEKEWQEYLKVAQDCQKKTASTTKPVEVLNHELREEAGRGNKEKVESLLAKKARVDAEDPSAGLTPLHKAAFKGQLDMVSFLIDAGAPVNAQDASGATPLHNSCYKGQLPIVEYLISKRADVNLTDNYKRTPLDKATTNEHEEVMDFLRRDRKSVV